MHRLPSLHRPLWIGLVAAALVALGLGSFHLHDPTLLNLKWPARGVGNWLGYPGALLLGTLVELFGTAALAVPLLVLNWVAVRQGRPGWHRYGMHSLVLLVFGAGLHGLVAPHPAPLGLGTPGVVGWLAAQWAVQSTGAAVGMALCGGMVALSVQRLLHGLPWARIAADAKVFATYGWQRLRQGTVVAAQGSAAAGTAGVSGLRAAVWGVVGGLLALVAAHNRFWGRLARGLGRWRRSLSEASLGRIKASRTVARPRPQPVARREPARPPARHNDTVGPGALDDFDAWFAAVHEAPAAAAAGGESGGPAPEARPQRASPTARREDWERQFERFAENLDLDWQRQGWQQGRQPRQAAGPESEPPAPAKRDASGGD